MLFKSPFFINSDYCLSDGCQYHGCWCPGSIGPKDISSHDIDYVEYVGPGLTRGRILNTCAISTWSNDIKGKYMLMLPLRNLTCKGLTNEINILISSAKWWSWKKKWWVGGGCGGVNCDAVMVCISFYTPQTDVGENINPCLRYNAKLYRILTAVSMDEKYLGHDGLFPKLICCISF